MTPPNDSHRQRAKAWLEANFAQRVAWLPVESLAALIAEAEERGATSLQADLRAVKNPIYGTLYEQLMACLSLAHRSLWRCETAQRIITHGFDGTHHADITIRSDGQDYHCEADWARHALRFMRKLAVAAGITEIKKHVGGGNFELHPFPPAPETGGKGEG